MSKHHDSSRSALPLAAGLGLALALSAAAGGTIYPPATARVDPSPAAVGEPLTITVEGLAVGCNPVLRELLYGISLPQPAGEPPYDHTFRATFDQPCEGGIPEPSDFHSTFTFHPFAAGRTGIQVVLLSRLLDDQQEIDLGTFTVDVEDASAPSETLGLHGGRFEATATWKDFAGRTGTARVIPGPSGVSGQLWFFSPDNPELTVKVLDGCAFNDRYWVLSAGATNVEYHLRVTDTQTGTTWTRDNALGHFSQAGADTSAFVCQ